MNKQTNRQTDGTRTPLRRRFWLAAALLASLVFLAACETPGPGGGGGVGTVDSVSIDQGDITLGFGATRQLSATVDASGGASTAVDWSSTNTAIASVSDSGLVTAGTTAGSATITATSRSDRTKTDSISVTVQEGGGGDPTAPTLTFTADPASISSGEDSTLNWSITGDYTAAQITNALGDVVADELAATGSTVVSPVVTTEYTLTVNYGTSSVVSTTTTVAIRSADGAPTISSFSAEVVPGSQVRLTWVGTDAVSWDLEAVGAGGAAVPLGSGLGDGGEVTVDIPASTTPSYRLTLTNPIDVAVAEIGRPDNVVVNTLDYDPYDGSGSSPEPAIEGTLREVLANAATGSVIGFASDITAIDLPGVGFYREVTPIADAHLIVDKNVTISAPAASPITLQGTSAQPPGDPSVALTWHSRMVYVAPGVEATLENLVITGGDFIFSGAGINNMGNLTIRNVTVTGNRAFNDGGGVRNAGGATLNIIDSEISNNQAIYLDDEVGTVWDIRGLGGVGNFGTVPLGDGGGVRNLPGGTINVENSSITGNYARFSGAGVYNEGSMTVVDTEISGNEANYAEFNGQPLTTASSQYSYGGGVMNGDGATFTMTGDGILDNFSAEQGGGLWHALNATTTLTNVNVGGNEATRPEGPGYGGGIMHHYYTGEEDRLTLTGVTYTPGNTPQDLLADEEGPRPAGLGIAVDADAYRMDTPATR